MSLLSPKSSASVHSAGRLQPDQLHKARRWLSSGGPTTVFESNISVDVIDTVKKPSRKHPVSNGSATRSPYSSTPNLDHYRPIQLVSSPKEQLYPNKAPSRQMNPPSTPSNSMPPVGESSISIEVVDEVPKQGRRRQRQRRPISPDRWRPNAGLNIVVVDTDSDNEEREEDCRGRQRIRSFELPQFAAPTGLRAMRAYRTNEALSEVSTGTMPVTLSQRRRRGNRDVGNHGAIPIPPGWCK